MVILMLVMSGWPVLLVVSACCVLLAVRSRRRCREMAWTMTALQEFNRRALNRIDELEREALEDGLTGLNNRRFMDGDLPRELERTRRFGRELSLAILDIDAFKQINDGYSHQVGDLVLAEMAGILETSCRAVDSVVRYGGDEFIMYFPETGLGSAAMICQRMIEHVRGYDWSAIALGLRVTLSIGLASTRGAGTAASLLDAADEQLYRAKESGRDRLAFADPLPALIHAVA